MNDWLAASTTAWEPTAYIGPSSEFKRQRLRHLDRIRQVVDLVRGHEYVVVLGPAYSEKTRLLLDVVEVLAQSDLFTPVYLNLWRVRTDDEASFFSSFAQLICRSDSISSLPYIDHELAEKACDAPGLRTFLDNFLRRHDRHLVLLIDHLQVLPQDLTHRLLQVLRAAYMERRPVARRQLDVVVAGSAVLAELSHDSTSPFNMARGVFQGPLAADASLALAEANLVAFATPCSPSAAARIVQWAGGDSYLIPLVVANSQDKAIGYRRQRITQTVVDQAAWALIKEDEPPPVRAAIQAIEEDPDTLLDVVALLRNDLLLRNQAHQLIMRTGVDRLQLSGAVVLQGEAYRIKNDIYRQALRRHFVQGRVAHVLRMNGRWQEAIHYLSAQLATKDLDRRMQTSSEQANQEGAHREQKAGRAEESRTDLLEAIIQSIYAANREEDAYRSLLDGIQLGFHLSDVRIYRSYAGRGELRLVETDQSIPTAAESFSLDDESLAEVRTFRSGDFAMRGETGSRRLLAALTPERRPIGIVTIEHYSTETEPHTYPPHLFSLLRFLRHASSAIENVVMRSAIQEIGRAVLDASTLTSKLDHVLQVVLNAVGGDAAQLHLLDAERVRLMRFLLTGDGASVRSSEASIELASANHPAVMALRNRSLTPTRQLAPPGLYAYLPLVAGGMQLGVLSIFFAADRISGFSMEDRKSLETFADQVAIAVHNMQLLRQTDEALQEKVRQLESLQRKVVQERDQELQNVAGALVHRVGNATGDVRYHLSRVRQALADGGDRDSVQATVDDASQHIEQRIRRLQDLMPPLVEIADLASVHMAPIAPSELMTEVVRDLLPKTGNIEPVLQLDETILIEGSRQLLYDTMLSLLENGCEAMPQGGKLYVQVARIVVNSTVERAQIRIRDTGVGIAEQHKAHMFELGFSTKSARDPNPRRGRGMFTCRAIIRKHGGEITIDSQEGQGTAVTILLPLLGAGM